MTQTETTQKEEKKSEGTERESGRVTYHEIIWVGGHESSQDLFRPDPISLSRRHKRSIHIHKILMPLRNTPHASPRALVLVSTHHRYLRSDTAEVW